MDKIWILKKSKQTKNYRVFKTETELLKAISPNYNQEVYEYELKCNFEVVDFLKQKERDIQLRSVLGELEKSEEVIINFINTYIDIAPEGRVFKRFNKETSTKEEITNNLKKYQGDKKEIANIIVKNKKYFIKDVSTDVSWYKVLLSVHNFRDHICDQPVWDRETKKYIKADNSTEEIKKNFILAKKELKKK